MKTMKLLCDMFLKLKLDENNHLRALDMKHQKSVWLHIVFCLNKLLFIFKWLLIERKIIQVHMMVFNYCVQQCFGKVF